MLKRVPTLAYSQFVLLTPNGLIATHDFPSYENKPYELRHK